VNAVIIDWTGVRTKRSTYNKGAVIFSQGGASSSVLHLEQGTARLSIVSLAGNTATVAVLHAGDFFGQGCLAGQSRRFSSAVAITACTLIEIESEELKRQLSANRQLAELFVRHMLTRNIRIEEDLRDQLLNAAEKRLARTLLLMAGYDEEQDKAQRVLPHISQTVLAEMIGTCRERVNRFMNKFRKSGYMEYQTGRLTINASLVAVLTADTPRQPR
jgi:CRP-like cAMP-binding protein